MRVVKFRPDLVVKVLQDRGVLLKSELDDVILRGRAIEKVVAAIDGSKTETQIVEALAPDLSAPEVYYWLMQLEKSDYLSTETALSSEALHLFWLQHDANPDEAIHTFNNALVTVHAVNGFKTEPFQGMLEEAGIKTGKDGHLNIVLTNSYLEPELSSLNKKYLSLQQPWLLAKPIGKEIWLGPLFHPGQTGCWDCLQVRIKNLQPLHELTSNKLTSNSEGVRAPLASEDTTAPTVQSFALRLLTVEVMKWFGLQNNHSLSGVIQSYNTTTHKARKHILTRRPQCPSCGDPTPTQQQPISLQSQKKVGYAQSGFRTLNPNATFEKFRHHISPITGIVRHVKPVSLPHPSVHLYSAGHGMRPLSNLPADQPAMLRDQSVGKGFSAAQARTSALCEALERYAGISQGTEHRVLASAAQLGEQAIHPNTCMLFSKTQYEEREAWHAACDHPFQHVPKPFEPEAQIEWTPVWSLTLKRKRFLPTAFCYFNYKGPHPDFCRADSNGNAAGNTLEEAILQGMLEVIERDAVSMWWYNRLQRPAVDIQSFGIEPFDEMISFYRSINRELWVLDLTADTGIPTFAAISRRTDQQPEDIIFGFGAHLEARMAVQRALTEMNQLLPLVIEQNQDGSTQYAYDGKLERSWWQTITIQTNPYLKPSPGLNPKTAQHFDTYTSPDLLEDVQYCLNKLGSLGLETLVLNQTRPDIGLPVVKVIIPGMRIFWKRWAPGRLFEVPVKMGWLREPRLESELNPFPFFL